MGPERIDARGIGQNKAAPRGFSRKCKELQYDPLGPLPVRNGWGGVANVAGIREL